MEHLFFNFYFLMLSLILSPVIIRYVNVYQDNRKKLLLAVEMYKAYYKSNAQLC